VWKIYKEGQGKWSRGILAFLVAIGAIYTVVALHGSLPFRESFQLPVVSWSFDYRYFIEGPILIAALVFGVWLFNHAPVADFLIDTENELKNKVTWPSKKEEVNASIVVVVTVALLSVFIFFVDSIFALIQGGLY
jgi:preprotein translocase subunit SecE